MPRLDHCGAVVLGGVAVLPLRGAHRRQSHQVYESVASASTFPFTASQFSLTPSPPPQAAQADAHTHSREPPLLHSLPGLDPSSFSPPCPLSPLSARSIFSLLSRCGGCMRSYSLPLSLFLSEQDRSSSHRQGITRSLADSGFGILFTMMH